MVVDHYSVDRSAGCSVSRTCEFQRTPPERDVNQEPVLDELPPERYVFTCQRDGSSNLAA